MCIFLCMYVCIYACMHVCMYVCACTYVYALVRTLVGIHNYVFMAMDISWMSSCTLNQNIRLRFEVCSLLNS